MNDGRGNILPRDAILADGLKARVQEYRIAVQLDAPLLPISETADHRFVSHGEGEILDNHTRDKTHDHVGLSVADADPLG